MSEKNDDDTRYKTNLDTDVDGVKLMRLFDDFIFGQTRVKQDLISNFKNSVYEYTTNNFQFSPRLIFCETYTNSNIDLLLKLVQPGLGVPLHKIKLSPSISTKADIIKELELQVGYLKNNDEGEKELCLKKNAQLSIIHFQNFDDVLISSNNIKTPFSPSRNIQHALVDFFESDYTLHNAIDTNHMISVITYNSTNIFDNIKIVKGYQTSANEKFSNNRFKLEYFGAIPDLLNKATCHTSLIPPSKFDLIEEFNLPTSYFRYKLDFLKDNFNINLVVEPESLDVLAETIINSDYKKGIVEVTDCVFKPYIIDPVDFSSYTNDKIKHINLSAQDVKFRLEDDKLR